MALLLTLIISLPFCHASQASISRADPLKYFSSNYAEAREKFLESAREAGAEVESHRHPLVGPGGGHLYTDVALFGPDSAESVVVLASGTHGVEGFAGSAVQTGLFREGIASRLPPDMRLVMIHAVNPHGFAHGRRFDEDNVDINRNFVDHSKPYPANPGYDALADVILPQTLSFWETTKSGAKLLWYRLKNGKLQRRKAISQGQYTHPDGLFFGGKPGTWSDRTLTQVVTQHLQSSKKVIFIGFHTGLGQYGAAELIMNVPKRSASYSRAKACWGDLVRTTMNGKSVSIQPYGTVKLAIPKMLPEAEVTALSLEFGTFGRPDVFWALRAENWLHHRAGSQYPDKNEIKAELLRVFYPNDVSWKRLIWGKGYKVVNKAISCLDNSFSEIGDLTIEPPLSGKQLTRQGNSQEANYWKNGQINNY